MSYRASDRTEKEREASAEAAELAAVQRALRARRRRVLWIALAIVVGLALAALVAMITFLTALGGIPRDGPGCVRPSMLSDGGVEWVDHCVNGVPVSPASRRDAGP